MLYILDTQRQGLIRYGPLSNLAYFRMVYEIKMVYLFVCLLSQGLMYSHASLELTI